ncbi:MAG: polymer-forming cytoskeletal protein [Elusimicrobia bacterium]|nr:polymer-forming cytoskeletal protein [Elusimicrobiota bacterium]
MFDSRKAGRFDGNESMTLIGEEAYVHGQLAAKGSLRVEGSVEGDITDAVSVEIGKKGRVKGNVAAETVSVAGELEGDVVASRTVEILAAARLTGNIRTPNLRVEDGAFFDGTCAMRGAAAPAAAPVEGGSAA